MKNKTNVIFQKVSGKDAGRDTAVSNVWSFAIAKLQVLILAGMLILITGCEGPIGPMGPEGTQGQQGASGGQGEQGGQGVSGLNSYIVIFNSNGGSPRFNFVSVLHGNTITEPANPVKTGDNCFDGWYKEADFSNLYDFETDTVTANITLYAKWIEAHDFSGTWTTTGKLIKTCQIVSCNGTHSIADEFVQINSGTFKMGSPSTEPDRNNDGRENYRTADDGNVTVSSFNMSKYQVTQELYQAVMGVNPSSFHGGSDREPTAGEIQEKRPVEMVTWFDAVEFCNKLSEREGLTPVYEIDNRTPESGYPITDATVTANWSNNGYRLPTEAEWEYACRAGTETRWYFGETESELVNYAWYTANSGDNGTSTNRKTHQVGLKQPNAWGLFDMYGNVNEWCWDWISSYDNAGGSNNPRGASSGSRRVLRGGGWSNLAMHNRSASRNFILGDRSSVIGFRLVCALIDE